MVDLLDTPRFPRLFPRRRIRRLARWLHALILVFLLWNAIEVYLLSDHFVTISKSPETNNPRHPRSERIFIASIHWNNEAILRSHWNDAVLDLAQTLGPDRVFLSVFESGSYDNTKGALRELDADLEQMGVGRNITLSNVTHVDEIVTPDEEAKGEGWIATARGVRELRRIPYLARLRNRSLQPLEDLAREGVVFDTVLFLNDVVFTTDDVLELLDTNEGDYAAVCSLDFSHPPAYYDTFALRDWEGHGHVTQTWPYFRSSTSRRATKVLAPVPVSSCWNGMVAMPALPFYDAGTSQPLRFRGISDTLAQSHLEGSECCLIHADNPFHYHGVFLNPRVRVGYHNAAYRAVHPVRNWLSPWQIFSGLWANRLWRWTTTNRFREWTVRGRLNRWERADPRNLEMGGFCLVNEMQVLKARGWAHV